MSKFITKNDPWGIRKTVYVIWDRTISYRLSNPPYLEFGFSIDFIDRELGFNVFFNQIVPPIWRADTMSIKRHIGEIEELAKTYEPYQAWVAKEIPNWRLQEDHRYAVRNYKEDISCWNMNSHSVDMIKKNFVRLLTYEEIAMERIRLQKMKNYRESEGFTPPPLEEEYIQLRIIKR